MIYYLFTIMRYILKCSVVIIIKISYMSTVCDIKYLLTSRLVFT